MLSSILFGGAIVCGVAAAYWYVSSAMKIATSINTKDALNDPLLRECRAELDDHTYVVGHTPTAYGAPKKFGAV